MKHKVRCRLFFALIGLMIGIPATSTAQQLTATDIPNHDLLGRAFAQAVEQQLTAEQTSPQPVRDPPASATPAQSDAASAPPMHTGLAALVYTTWDDFKTLPRRRSTWAIVGIGAGLALASHPADDNLNRHLVGSKAVDRFWRPGQVLGSTYTQVGISVGLYAIGRYVVPHAEGQPKTNKWSHMGFDLLRAQILSQALVQGIKVTTRRDRPTGECCSFPSGHAASAFALASVIERHFGYRMAWPTMVAATYVATSRLHDNRHFLSDVVFGSAIGTAAGWTVVGRHGRTNYALMPVPIRGGLALQLTRRAPGE